MSPRGRRIQGEGSIYQRKDGRWFGEVDFGRVGGKRVRRTVSAKTKKELLPKFAALKAEASAGVMTSDSTVEEWMTYWLNEVVGRRNRKASTMRDYRSKVANWVIPHLGAHKLARLQPQHIRALLALMADEGKSAQTAAHVHGLLLAAIEQAVKDRVLPYNPVRSVDLPEVKKKPQPKLTLLEARKVLNALDGRPDAARWTVALLAGLRQGEALGLRWEDVDLEGKTLSIERAAQRIVGQGIQMITPKTDTSVRIRPMVKPVWFALSAMPGPREGFVFGCGEKPTDSKEDSLRWHAMLDELGVEQKPLKAARATTASLLSEAKVPPKIIAEIMGHAQSTTTEKHYIIGDQSQYLAANEALEQLLALG